MKIAYISHTRFPNEKAHGHQIARVCEALALLKHSVTLVAPGVHNEISQDPKKYYHLKQDFPVEHLPTKDALLSPLVPGRFAMIFTMKSFRDALKKHLIENKYDLLYTRSHHVLPALLRFKMPVVIELHAIPKRGTKKFIDLCKQCKRVVALTSPMRDELVQLGVSKAKIIVEGDAVDLDRFSKFPQSKKARHHFDVPDGIPVVGYVGSLVTMDKLEKGVDLLIKAMVNLKKTHHHAFLLVVGGPKDWSEKYRLQAIHAGLTDDNMQFYGPVPHKLIPDAIAACDMCIYPVPKSKHKFFSRDTSPLKLFEYLAAGKPIICGDIPPVRDVVSKDCVQFVEPGSVTSLGGALRDAIDRPDAGKKRAKKGLEVVKKYTWEKRMARILRELKMKDER